MPKCCIHGQKVSKAAPTGGYTLFILSNPTNCTNCGMHEKVWTHNSGIYEYKKNGLVWTPHFSSGYGEERIPPLTFMIRIHSVIYDILYWRLWLRTLLPGHTLLVSVRVGLEVCLKPRSTGKMA